MNISFTNIPETHGLPWKWSHFEADLFTAAIIFWSPRRSFFLIADDHLFDRRRSFSKIIFLQSRHSFVRIWSKAHFWKMAIKKKDRHPRRSKKMIADQNDRRRSKMIAVKRSAHHHNGWCTVIHYKYSYFSVCGTDEITKCTKIYFKIEIFKKYFFGVLEFYIRSCM